MFDVVIVGAGPAGLSAALLLGRCRRSVRVFDSEQPRNAASHSLHGFLTRDGIAPQELRRIAREQLHPYESVELETARVCDAQRTERGFQVRVEDGRTFESRALLLATGMVDALPEVPGFAEFYGHGVFHCPYCDGWEVRDGRLVAYGEPADAAHLGMELTAWSSDVVVCTNGQGDIPAELAERLQRNGISIRQEVISRLTGPGRLEQIEFRDGTVLRCDALFFSSSQTQHSDLTEALGCDMTWRGVAATGRSESTNVPGLFVAGDASRRVQLAIVAAAEGAEAAFAINTELLKLDLE